MLLLKVDLMSTYLNHPVLGGFALSFYSNYYQIMLLFAY
jgi:hypothetical protein